MITAGVVSISEIPSLKTGNNSKNKPHWISSPDSQTQALSQMQELAGFKGREEGGSLHYCSSAGKDRAPNSPTPESILPLTLWIGNLILNSAYLFLLGVCECRRSQ